MRPFIAAVWLHMLGLYAAIAVAVGQIGQVRRRRWWVHPINQSRDDVGLFSTLVMELRRYPEKHQEYFRMSTASFDHILSMIRDDITKEDTPMRKAIKPDLKLAVTLHHLATGSDYRTVSKHYRLGESTVRGIVRDVCEALWTRLQPVYLREPQTDADWQAVAEGFMEHWNFPHCLGAIDGKHVTIQKPPNAGSEWYNYKGSHSMNLMAIADSRYRFLMVDIGQYGSESDGGIWEETSFNRRIQGGQVKFPDAVRVGERLLPYYFVGDEAFPLKPFLMRPFPGRDTRASIPKRVFNYRLSRARRVIENAFGILTHRWTLLRRPILGSPASAESRVCAMAVLHNYLMIVNDKTYMPPGMADVIDGGQEGGAHGGWRQVPDDHRANLRARRWENQAVNIRNELVDYVNNEGAVDWQEDHIRQHR